MTLPIKSDGEALTAAEWNTVAQSLNEFAAIYDVKNYGALGDGRGVRDLGHAAASNIITSLTANFTGADIGKIIELPQAGAGNSPIVTTIQSIDSATQARIATNAVTTLANQYVAWGTDDYAAILAAYDAAKASGLHTTLYFPAGLYFTGSTLVLEEDAGVSIRGASRQTSLIFHAASSGVACLQAEGGVGTLSPGFYNVSNKSGLVSLSDIGLGSTIGHALYLHGATNVSYHDLLFFSAGQAAAMMRINGGAMNQFNHIKFDQGNLENFVEWSLGMIVPLHALWIEATDATPIVTTEQVFVNCRSDAAHTSYAIKVVGNPLFGCFGIQFTNVFIKASVTRRGYYVDGAIVTIVGGNIEGFNDGGGSLGEGIVAGSAATDTTLIVYGMDTDNARLRINKGANALAIKVSDSYFHQLFVDVEPTSLRLSNTTFAAESSGADGGSIWGIAEVVPGASSFGPSIGRLYQGYTGVAGVNAVMEIAGGASANGPTTAGIALRARSPAVTQTWVVVVDTDGKLLVVNSTTMQVIAKITAAGELMLGPGAQPNLHLAINSVTNPSLDFGQGGASAPDVTVQRVPGPTDKYIYLGATGGANGVWIDTTNPGIVYKDAGAPPHYWRVAMSPAGAFDISDLGISLP